MSYQHWLIFVFSSIFIISTPGPVVTLLINTSINKGIRAALLLIPGIFIGDVFALLIADSLLHSLFSVSGKVFFYMQILGSIYLIYLGVEIFQEIFFKKDLNKTTKKFSISYLKGFFSTLVNPKTFMFYVSFFPRFINENGSMTFQLLILSMTFLLIGLINDVIYSIVSNKMSKYLNDKVRNGITYVCSINLIITGISLLLYL